MAGQSISRRGTLRGAGAAALGGLLPQAAIAQAASMPASDLMAASAQLSISNGLITANLLLDFYKGTRFDHSGVIGSLKLNGREFYGPWFDAVQDDVPDFRWVDGKVITGRASSIMGPAEEFDPVGFDDAVPGGAFLKPGVGLLLRPDDKPYDHYRLYAPVPDSDSRGEEHFANNLSTLHSVSGGGFGYEYEKALSLPPGKPQLVIAHTLRNTGSKPIVTSVYDHNFVILNPGNADMRVTLPFAPPQPPASSRLKVEGNAISWPQALDERQTGAMTMSQTPQPYDFTVTDTRTGASIRAQADRPAAQYKLWSIRTVMAVEPYIAIAVPPGATQEWTYTYTYSAGS